MVLEKFLVDTHDVGAYGSHDAQHVVEGHVLAGEDTRQHAGGSGGFVQQAAVIGGEYIRGGGNDSTGKGLPEERGGGGGRLCCWGFGDN